MISVVTSPEMYHYCVLCICQLVSCSLNILRVSKYSFHGTRIFALPDKGGMSGFALGPRVAVVKSAMFVSSFVPGLCWAIVLSVWWWFIPRYSKTSSRTG